MADETFEEDLFADLYTDDAAASKEEPTQDAKIENEPPVEAAPKTESHEHKDEGEEQMYGDADEDDIDINLGGNENESYEDSGSQHHDASAHGPSIKEDGKMFIGGLNWETTDESLKNYFSRFGEVLECTVMRDGPSGRSRGFGFLTFKDARTVNVVMVKEHFLDGKIIDPKRAIPRDEQERTSKIFVGGVSQDAHESDFKEYFMQFGRVIDATLMMDKDTGRPRGFGFVTFDSEAAVDACLAAPLEILGKPIEVKKAQPRGNMREEEEARARGRGAGFQKGGNDGQADMSQQSGGQMAPGGMTPAMMAQYWQRMQQYFVMMQQQMAMGRGMGGAMGGMNPQMMMQMQQMQAMQAMQQQMQGGGGSGGNGNGGNDARSQSPQSPAANMASMAGMGNMTPQMMQAMQMQQMQGMGGGNNYAAGGQNNPGGRIGTPGYNAYEQQMFEQQKYEQQQVRRSQRDVTGYGQPGYGNNMAGGPTSWEGMYDDVPQPDAPANGNSSGRGGFQGKGGSNRGSAPPTGPVSAPPANAPTGPKNAGKPGANYRGGGRGGQRGFHPYAR